MLRLVETVNLKNEPFVSKIFRKNFRKYRTPVTGSRDWKWLDAGRGERYCSHTKEKNIVHSPLGDFKMPDLPFHHYVMENWSLWEKKIALECVMTGKKYAFRDVMRCCKALAGAFQNKLNLSKGDVIGLVLPNCPEFPIVVLAGSLCGIIPSPLNPSYTVDEMLRQMQDCKTKLLVTDSKNYEKCHTAVKQMKANLPILVVKHKPDDEIPQGGISLLELFDQSISGAFKPVEVKMDDPFILPYSSGTTGGPKGVILSHRNVVSNLGQLGHPETNIMRPTTWLTQERTFAVLPMYHAFGMVTCTFFSLREGCRHFILPAFKPQLFVSTLYLKRVNVVYVVPLILRVLSNESVKAKYLRRLKFIVNGAAPLDIRDAHIVLDKAKHVKVAQGYGMTETSPVLTHTSTKRMQKLTSIGIPIASTKLKVVDPETGEALPKGQHGELCAWGPQVMKGYFNRPEETKNAFDKYGWLRTGDVAYYDDDEDFFIVQRLKELIKVKGYQVAPQELEDVLRTHPKIADAVVIGVPDEKSGEAPRAFIIVQKGAELSEEEVKDYIKKKLSSYKQLTGGVRFVDEFPKNTIGKVLRMELKKMP